MAADTRTPRDDEERGQRVASNVVSNGVTTSTTDYLAGGLEEVTTAGSATTLTKYERVPGVCSVVVVGSGPSESLSYVATDGLGSVSEALDGSGNVTAQQLYGPYGTGRFALGSMPTSKGYTGQYADATTGLDYYGTRSYDPLVGQFTSADTANDGLNRYAYVHDDPETATDPTGKRCAADGGVCPGAGGGGGGSGGSGGCGQCGKSPCAPNCSPPKQPPTPTGPSGGKGSGGGCQSENCGGGSCYTSCGSDPSGGNGTGGNSQASSNPFLQFIETQLRLAGIDIEALGLVLASYQQDAGDAVAYFMRVIEHLLEHNHGAKDPGRLARRAADLESAEGWGSLLSKIGDALVAIGFFADAANYALSFYNGSSRPDLTGETRVLAAFGAGLIHATIMTLFTIGGAATVESFFPEAGPVAGWVGGFLGGLLGGDIADVATPIIVNALLPSNVAVA